MRTLLVVAVLGAVCMLLGATASSAADHGQVPASTLAQMGLGGMQPMSDLQGQAIRGMGRRSGGTIQANIVVQAGKAGSANGGSGGSFSGGSGGTGGAAGSVYFNNDVATFIQVNVSRGSLLGGGIVVVP
jgi:hypothetical protein